MRFMLTSLGLELRASLLSRNMLILLLALLIALPLPKLFAGEAVVSVRAAVVIDPADETARGIFEAIPRTALASFTEYNISQLGEIEALVAANELECAFVIPTDLRERFVGGSSQGSIEIIRSPRTATDELLSKLVFCAVIIAMAEPVTADELAKSLNVPVSVLENDISALYETYSGGESFVHANAEWSGNAANSLPPKEPRIPHGILALVMIISAMLSVAGRLGEKKRLGKVLTCGKTAIYCISVYLAAFARLLVLAGIGLAVIRPTSEAPVIAVVSFSGLLAALVLVVVLLPLRPVGLYTAGVFLTICCIVLGGVLINPAELGGFFVRASAFIPTGWYIESALGSTAGWILPLAAVLSGFLAVIAAVIFANAKSSGK